MANKKKPLLGVVIVTYNRIELLKECVNACFEQTEKFARIIVVNNHSEDGTKEYLDSLKNKNLTVIHSKENLGGAGGFYMALEASTSFDLDYVLLIDDDAILDKNYNHFILKYMQKNEVGICGYSGCVKTNNKNQYEHRRHLKRGFHQVDSREEEYEGDYFDYELSTFCGVYIPMQYIKEIGLPRKDFFIWFDDTEYCLRLAKYGKIRNVNSAFLNHKTTLTRASGYNWKSYYGLRNNLVILKEYYGFQDVLKYKLMMRFYIVAGKLMCFIKRDNYYKEVSNIYKDALLDAKNNRMGLNPKYTYKYKISKKEV